MSSNTVIRSLHDAGAAVWFGGGLALATTAYRGVLGAKLAKDGDTAVEGGAKPAAQTPDDVANAQQQLRVLQWATPVLTGIIVILGAQRGEQQRPAERLRGVGKKVADRLPDSTDR